MCVVVKRSVIFAGGCWKLPWEKIGCVIIGNKGEEMGMVACSSGIVKWLMFMSCSAFLKEMEWIIQHTWLRRIVSKEERIKFMDL